MQGDPGELLRRPAIQRACSGDSVGSRGNAATIPADLSSPFMASLGAGTVACSIRQSSADPFAGYPTGKTFHANHCPLVRATGEDFNLIPSFEVEADVGAFAVDYACCERDH